jgi:hypothetical protein
MVINSTNINQTNNYLSSFLNSLNTKKDHDIGSSGPSLGQAQKCGWFKRLIVNVF